MLQPLSRDRVRMPAFQAYLPPGAAATQALKRGCCRWPLGDVEADAFRFCLAPTQRGAYCPAHYGLALRGRR